MRTVIVIEAGKLSDIQILKTEIWIEIKNSTEKRNEVSKEYASTCFETLNFIFFNKLYLKYFETSYNRLKCLSRNAGNKKYMTLLQCRLSLL